MPLKLYFDTGTETWVPFAKKKLSELKLTMRRRNLSALHKTMVIDDTTIALSSRRQKEIDYDAIRITGATTGWIAKETTSGVATPKTYQLRKSIASKIDSANPFLGEVAERFLETTDYYFNGVRYVASVVTGPVGGIPDSGTLLAIYNSKTKTYVWTPIGLTGADGTPYEVMYIDFTFVTDDNIWLVAYLKRSTGGLAWTRKVVVLDVSGNAFALDYPTLGLFDTSNLSDRLIQPSLAPVGVLNAMPYFFVDGSTSVLGGSYSAKLVTDADEIVMITSPWPSGVPQDLSGFAGRDCGASVLAPDGTESLEVIFQFGQSSTIFGHPLSGNVYGYSTISGLVLLESFTYTIGSGGTIVTVLPAQNYFGTQSGGPPAARGGLPLRDRKSTACFVENARLHAAVYKFTGTGTNTTPGIVSFGFLTLSGYSAMTSINSIALNAPSVYTDRIIFPFATNSLHGFIFRGLYDLDDTNTYLRFIDSAGNIRVTSTFPPDNLLPLFGATPIARHFILYEKDESITYLERGTVSGNIRTFERWIFKAATGTKTLISTFSYDFTVTPPPPSAFLDGVVFQGKAYLYALAEDTPDTELGTSLRLITADPGSSITYLVLLNSNGTIVTMIQANVGRTFTLDASEMSFKAVKELFAQWDAENAASAA